MNLAQLIDSQKRAGAGTLRDMERRAAEAGTPISRSSLSAYANGKVQAVPDEVTRHALAHALDVSFEAVTAAALESVAPDMAVEGRTLQRAEAWLALTEGRSDVEVEHLLAVVRAVLTATDSQRSPVVIPRSDHDTNR